MFRPSAEAWRDLVQGRTRSVCGCAQRCRVEPSRRLQDLAGGTDPVAETGDAGRAHLRGMVGEIILPGSPVLQPVLRADDESSLGWRRVRTDQDVGTSEAPQVQHRPHVLLQPGEVFIPQGGVHFEFDDVEDDAPVRLISTANTKPKPNRIEYRAPIHQYFSVVMSQPCR